MKTDDLIATLALDATPVPSDAPRLWLIAALCAGSVIAVIGVLLTLGPRPDLGRALATASFWIKWALTLGTLAIAFKLAGTLSRPEGEPGWKLALMGVPFLFVAGLGVAEMLALPSGERMAVWLGSSSRECPWRIVAAATPVFFSTMLAVRQLAPTKLRLTGFVIGLVSGAAAATAYSLHCDEDASSFIATWYVLGMVIPGLIGALLGPRLLRW